VTAVWAWIVATIGPWVVLGGFGIVALALLICTVAMVEVTRRQQTTSEVIVGVILTIGCLLLAGVCAGVAWSLGLSVILGR
jgi:hypothetical protein